MRESIGVGIWKEIQRGWEEFSLGTSILVMNGRNRSSGWITRWGSIIERDFSHIVLPSHFEDIRVADFWDTQTDLAIGPCISEAFPWLGNRAGMLVFKAYKCSESWSSSGRILYFGRRKIKGCFRWNPFILSYMVRRWGCLLFKKFGILVPFEDPLFFFLFGAWEAMLRKS